MLQKTFEVRKGSISLTFVTTVQRMATARVNQLLNKVGEGEKDSSFFTAY